MRLIRATDYTCRPWKNGGGVTFEIATDPVGADMDNFNWRLFMAEVDRAEPFSQLTEIDRILFAIAGNGMKLSVETAPGTIVGCGSDPACFQGAAIFIRLSQQ